MRIGTFFYTIGQGFKNLFRNKGYTLASIATISACLFLFGMFFSVLTNFRHIVLRAERYARASGNPVQYEWVLMQGVNDSAAQASELARLLAGRYAMVNLIPVNPVEGSGFVRPGKEQCVAFAEALRASGIVTKIRISAAQDIAGGCGQLRAKVRKSDLGTC